MRKYLSHLAFAAGFLAAFPLYSLEESELKFEEQTSSVAEYNSRLQEALAANNWWAVIDCSDIISYNFPTTPFAQETPYLSGYAYFQMG